MIKYFTSHPTASNLIMVLMVALGLFSLSSIRRELLPDFSKGEVQISVTYPGASATEVDESVCRRIEEAVEGVNYLKEVRSTASEGSAIVVAEMQEKGNIQMFLEDVKTEVEAINDFPELVDNITIKPLNRKHNVVNVFVSGDGDAKALKSYCEYLKDRLLQTTLVTQVEVEGFADHQLKVKVDRNKLMRYGLGISNIVEILKAKSIDIPSGILKTGTKDFLIRYSDRRRSIDDLKNLTIISGEQGAEIKLGDIATIVDEFELDEAQSFLNGNRSASLKVTMNKNDDILQVYDAVKSFVEKERKTAPSSIKLVLGKDRAKPVRSRLELLVNNGIQGIILVFLALWLFFSFRFSFWVAMGLPVSIIGALFFFPVFNLSVNMITMVALLVAIGLLMDDAIVIAENIAAKLDKGHSAFDAAVLGTKEVSLGVISSFLTTVCVFGPLTMISGNVGKIMKVLPVVLIIVLAVSLIEAFFILPNHLQHSLSHVNDFKSNRIRHMIHNSIEWFRETIVGNIIDIAVNWRYLFIGCVLCIFMLALSMFPLGILSFRLFPALDGDSIIVTILLPQGTPLKQTETVVKKVEKSIAKLDQHYTPLQPKKQHLVTNINIEYNKNKDAGETGPHLAQITVDLLDSEQRTVKLNNVLAFLRKETGVIPDVISLKFDEMMMGPGGSPIEIRIKGQDLQELKKVSQAMKLELLKIKGVSDIMDNLRPGKPELSIKIKEGITMLGIKPQEIANQLRTAFYGGESDNIMLGAEEYEIAVYLDNDSEDIRNFDYFHISLPSGKQVPLQSIADITHTRGYSRISNVNGIHTLTMTANVDRKVANVSKINTYINTSLMPGILKNHPKVSFAFEGEKKETAETGKSLLKAFAIGLLGIFILLSFQFKSYLDPLFVMLAIPFSLIGVIVGHILMGISISMPSMIGFVSLSGIVVNDSILLVEFLKIREREGASTPEAAKLASRDRFRAVMLTSMTTIAGLLPILKERSVQAQILIPLAVSIAFGLLASTMLVLFVIPVLYAIKDDFKKKA